MTWRGPPSRPLLARWDQSDYRLKMTAKQKALDVISSLPDSAAPQDIVSLLINIYRIKQGLADKGELSRASEGNESEAEIQFSAAAQVKAWRQLAGQWQSDSPSEEIDAIYAARTPGREIDL